ncbi:MAG: VWA domain-containing protein [Helicobacteraceae bacterium]|jgi:uncharacterized protein YegL|nr:VWA domain-containing protein [Helicobacteraceae bacterium]
MKKLLSIALICAFCALCAQAVDVVKPQPPKTNRVDVVFVLDTTGSMTGLIEGAKRKIWSIANAIVDQNPNALIRVGLIGYRDLGDEYVARYYPLTTDIQDIYAKLLLFTASGGGDTPESVNEALDIAITKMEWTDARTRANRIVFLVGDAPPHMDYDQDRKYPEIIAEAKQRGIIVNAVQAGDMDSTKKAWKEIARLGGGNYIAIPQDGGRVIVIDTPYDEEIIIIQRKLNSTVVPYGASTQQKEVKGKLQSYETAPAPAAADMSGFINKSSRGKEVITGEGDLVGDVANNLKKIGDIPTKELPKDMQSMSVKEREAYIAKQIEERNTLSRQLAEIVTKRDEFIKTAETKQDKKVDSFDQAISRILEKQVKE